MTWAVVAALFHVSACGRSEGGAETDAPAPRSTPARPRLAELRVADLTPPALRVSAVAEQVDALVKGAMEASFERAEGDPGACRAEIAVVYTLLVNRQPVLAADAGEARAFFEGEVFCPKVGARGDDVDGFRLTLDTQRAFGGDQGGAPERLSEALRQVVQDGAAGLFGQVRMRHASDDELRAALASSDHPGVLAEAASESGERRLADVVPELVRLSAHPNVRVATRAGAALGLLKVATPEVVRALVRMTDGPEPEKHLIAIHALADLGSDEAKRYLESLALGHPSPALREVARERLRALGKTLPREEAPEPVPDPLP